MLSAEFLVQKHVVLYSTAEPERRAGWGEDGRSVLEPLSEMPVGHPVVQNHRQQRLRAELSGDVSGAPGV